MGLMPCSLRNVSKAWFALPSLSRLLAKYCVPWSVMHSRILPMCWVLSMASCMSRIVFSVVASSNSPPESIFLLESSSTAQTFGPPEGSCQSEWTADKLCSLSYLMYAFLRFCLLGSDFARPSCFNTVCIVLCGILMLFSAKITFSRYTAFKQYLPCVSTINCLNDGSSGFLGRPSDCPIQGKLFVALYGAYS